MQTRRSIDWADRLLQACERDNFRDIVAIQVGGSSGRLQVDPMSDVDIFCYVNRAAVRSFIMETAPLLLAGLHPVVRVTLGPEYKAPHGWGYTAQYAVPPILQLFVRSEDDLVPNFVQSQPSKVCYDPAGRLHAVLAASSALSPPLEQISTDATVKAYFRLRTAVKEESRGHRWQARKYAADSLEHVLVLLRARAGVPPQDLIFRHSGRGMEDELDDASVRVVLALEARVAGGITQSVVSDISSLVENLSQDAQVTFDRSLWTELRQLAADRLPADAL